ncbi:MAG: hypothetical protein QOJ23_3346 [Actinomycetota bacterium]|jgi:hypothetical protein|nr:hypothetical protein [Actinomycetota bacterium]
MEASDRDGLAGLADAYSVDRELTAVGSAIYARLRGPLDARLSRGPVTERPAEWSATLQILVQLVTRPADFARARRGKRPTRVSWKALVAGVEVLPLDSAPDRFIDEIIAEVAAALSAG